MDSIKFVLKTFVVAIGLLAALQFPIEETTIEARTQNWIHASEVGALLKQVSLGAVKMAKDGYHLAEREIKDFSQKMK